MAERTMKEQFRQAAGVDKKMLRKSLLEARDSMLASECQERSAAACGHLSNWLKQKGATQFMGYASFRSELDLGLLIEWAWHSGVEVVMPKCEPTDRSMSLHRITDWNELVPGAYGIMEPDPESAPPLPQPQWPNIIIVPGVAFDRTGGRLGYGGGYYDRFAERLNAAAEKNAAIWIGAAFESQLVDGLPMQSHDKRMDGLLTENGLYFMNET